MTFRSLASSSKGNAYMVSDGETVLLLECGLPYKKLAEKSGFTLMDTTACFVTHEHKDHSRAAGQLIRHGVPVYMSEGTARALELWDAEIIEPNVPIMVGAFRVMAFRVAHDAADPVGYLIDDTRTGERLMFAADTRSLSYIVPRLTYIEPQSYTRRHQGSQDRLINGLKAEGIPQKTCAVVTDSALKNWITGMMSLIFLWNGLNPVSLEDRRRERRTPDGH